MASVHRQTFVDLVKRHGWTRGAELGVDKGILTGMLIRSCPELDLTAVDVFPDSARSHRAFELAEEFRGRLWLERTTTDVAARRIQDGLLDFVFIDADHSYAAVKQDIALWTSKVRWPGGWVGGHDYHPRKFPGVVQAVDEAFGKTVQHLPGTIWGVWR